MGIMGYVVKLQIFQIQTNQTMNLNGIQNKHAYYILVAVWLNFIKDQNKDVLLPGKKPVFVKRLN
jgi:hypothetical protein